MSPVRKIYSFEEVIPLAVAAVFIDAGLTALTVMSDPEFQKTRPRVEIIFKLDGQRDGANPRIALMADGTCRNSAWSGTLSIYAITDVDEPGKLIHAEFLSTVRSVCAVLGYEINEVRLPNHKIQQMVEGATSTGIRTADGYQQSMINFNVQFSVQQQAWALIDLVPQNP